MLSIYLAVVVVSVRLIAPKEVNILNIARNVTLNWRWTVQQYYNLNLTCQVKVGETNQTVS